MQLWIWVACPNPYTSFLSGTLAGWGSTAFARSSGFLIVQIVSSKAFAKHWIWTADLPFGSRVSWPVDHRGSSNSIGIQPCSNSNFRAELYFKRPFVIPRSDKQVHTINDMSDLLGSIHYFLCLLCIVLSVMFHYSHGWVLTWRWLWRFLKVSDDIHNKKKRFFETCNTAWVSYRVSQKVTELFQRLFCWILLQLRCGLD